MSVFTGGCALALSAEGGAPAAEAPAAAIAVAKGVEPSAVAMAASTRSASGAPLSEATSALWSRTRGASVTLDGVVCTPLEAVATSEGPTPRVAVGTLSVVIAASAVDTPTVSTPTSAVGVTGAVTRSVASCTIVSPTCRSAGAAVRLASASMLRRFIRACRACVCSA